MAVQFTPKPGKPHIKLDGIDDTWILTAFTTSFPRKRLTGMNLMMHSTACGYCAKHNPGFYKTPGEAARALHYGSANK